MIYMVEMALIDLHRRAEWDAWYLSHQHLLLSIPGIRASQRFETLHPVPSPFVALHEVDGPEVFTSAPYRAKAGPQSTGAWRERMNNWHRNLLGGADGTPDVPADARLVVVEDGHAGSLPAGTPVQWLDAAGLDSSIARRGFAIMPPAEADGLIGRPGLRVLKPISPRLTAADAPAAGH